MRNIADALGVSVSNIYHYFGNKEGLWLAILEHSAKELPKKLNAGMGNESDPLKRFDALLRSHLELSQQHTRESKIYFIDNSLLSPKGAKINRKIQTLIFDIYVKELNAMKQAGLVKTDHIKILAFNVLALVNWHLRWYRPSGPLPPEAINREIIDFALYGILGRQN